MYRKILSVDHTRLTGRFTINYTNATNTYALPTDFHKMTGYNQGVFPVDSDGDIFHSTKLSYAEEPSVLPGYRFDGDNIIFQNTTETDQEYVMIYRRQYTVLANLNQTLFTPDEFREEVLEMLQMYYNKFQRRFGEMNINTQFLDQLFNEMYIEVRRTNRNYSPYV